MALHLVSFAIAAALLPCFDGRRQKASSTRRLLDEIIHARPEKQVESFLVQGSGAQKGFKLRVAGTSSSCDGVYKPKGMANGFTRWENVKPRRSPSGKPIPSCSIYHVKGTGWAIGNYYGPGRNDHDADFLDKTCREEDPSRCRKFKDPHAPRGLKPRPGPVVRRK